MDSLGDIDIGAVDIPRMVVGLLECIDKIEVGVTEGQAVEVECDGADVVAILVGKAVDILGTRNGELEGQVTKCGCKDGLDNVIGNLLEIEGSVVGSIAAGNLLLDGTEKGKGD